MKRIIALTLAVVMLVLPLCSCGSEKKAYEASKKAYDLISEAYEITDSYASDVYEAWRIAINEDDEVLSDGVEYLADELSLSEAELIEGIAYFIAVEMEEEDWDELSDDEKDEYRDYHDVVFTVFEDNLFSFCIEVVCAAYDMNGEEAKAEKALNEAKTIMKDMSQNFSDYEHYPNLKEYYTTTSAFFEYCKDPTGSFEQSKTTINDYRKEARDFINDLNYIFED